MNVWIRLLGKIEYWLMSHTAIKVQPVGSSFLLDINHVYHYWTKSMNSHFIGSERSSTANSMSNMVHFLRESDNP